MHYLHVIYKISFKEDAQGASIYLHLASITGITGQDGSYLTELLLEKGYGCPAPSNGPWHSMEPSDEKPACAIRLGY